MKGGWRYDGKHFYWDPKKIIFSREELRSAWRKVMGKFDKNSTAPKGEQPKPKDVKKQPKQPFYCHLVNGEWDRKFRNKDGNIVE